MKTLITTLLAATALTAVSGGAMAADLAAPPAAAPAMAAPAPTNWDGPYIGASVGYGWGTADFGDVNTDPFDTASPSGFLVGAQAGYNFHIADQFVIGLEGNIDWVNESGASADPSYSINTRWEGSVRGRLGYDAGAFLPYIEAGVAFANADVTTDYPSNVNKTFTGWTAGAGVEFALADNLSLNVEYRYSDYGKQDVDAYPNHVHLTDSTVRVGLNYHF